MRVVNVPVGTLARRSKALLVVAAVALLAGCTPLAVDGERLDDTRWVSVSIAGQAPIAGSEPTLVFEDGRVRGSGGCNGYTGQEPVSITNNELELGPVLMTLGGCVGPDGEDLPVMAVEQTFRNTLGAADHIALRDGLLMLSGPAGELIFQRQR
jgi:heat shock protein HslJ